MNRFSKVVLAGFPRIFFYCLQQLLETRSSNYSISGFLKPFHVGRAAFEILFSRWDSGWRKPVTFCKIVESTDFKSYAVQKNAVSREALPLDKI
jgi:hypothetical protein